MVCVSPITGRMKSLTNIHNQVHADSSAFSPSASKPEVYAKLHTEANALFDGQRNWVLPFLFSFLFPHSPVNRPSNPPTPSNRSGAFTAHPHTHTQHDPLLLPKISHSHCFSSPHNIVTSPTPPLSSGTLIAPSLRHQTPSTGLVSTP